MKSKLLVLALPILFFGCEADEEEATLLGTWTVTSIDEYSGTSCTGTPEFTMDSLATEFGNAEFDYTLEFTEDAYTITMGTELTDEALCSLMGGTLDGDSCSVSMYTFTFNFPVDSLCINMEGTYENGSCSLVFEDDGTYETDGDAITMTEYAGTDSAEVRTGTWSITDDVATVSVADDSTCTTFTLTQ